MRAAVLLSSFRRAGRAVVAPGAALLFSTVLAAARCGDWPAGQVRAADARESASAPDRLVARDYQADSTVRTAVALERRAVLTTSGASSDRRAASIDQQLADSARRLYENAATRLPSVADWLYLRAAALTPDSLDRARHYARLISPAARERSRWVEATALSRFGDIGAAEAAWRAAGRPVQALRVRLSTAGTSGPSRDSIRDALLRTVAQPADAGDAREAIAFLDTEFAPLASAAELAVARRATALGQSPRAIAGYQRALAANLGTTDDRRAYAAALSRLRRHTDAAREYARVRDAVTATDRALAGRMAYERARALLRAGNAASATAALTEVRRTFDGEAAASAIYLLADMAADRGREREALALYDELARRHSDSEPAGPARFRAAVLSLALDGAAGARASAERLDLARRVRHDDSIAAGYWAGRAWALAGDSARARERWRETLATAPRSYYALLSARRLGERPWLPPDTGEAASDSVATMAVTRVAVLDVLGLGDEAGLERAWLARRADSSTARMLAAARAYHDASLASSGIRLATLAIDRGAPLTASAYRALYPFPFDSIIGAEARRHGVDPSFAAALIRQESNFTPGATSPAGARGLMQVMPSVGRMLAGGGRGWDAGRLYDPAVNVPLGMRHLAGSLGRHPHPAYALAAYNAGESRVRRWRRRAGAGDPELFVERIPFVETRDYVRIVLRNWATYEGLY